MGFLSKLFTGVDTDAEAKRAEELAAWEARLNANPRMQQVWTPEDWLAHEQQAAAEAAAYAPATYDDQVWQAAKEGAAEGLADMQRSVKDAATGAAAWSLRGVFGFVPWWVWLGGAFYVAWRLGFLKRWIASRA